MINIGLYIAYTCLSVTILFAVVFPLIVALKQPSTLTKSFIGVLTLLVVFGISFAFSDPTLSAKAQAIGITSFGAQLIGSGLTTLAVLSIVIFFGIVYSEIKSTF